MAKTPAADPAAQEVAAPDLVITLQAFCTRLSQSVMRPELIGAFHHTESAAGRLNDTEAAFKARFDAFLNKPI